MSEYRFTVPTVITLLRIGLIPYIVHALWYDCWLTACVLFVISAITDFLDGFIARRFRQQTALGALLDPLADKLLMVSFFATFYYKSLLFSVIPGWFILLLGVKELMMIVGAVLLTRTSYRFVIKPTVLGKLAMGSQVFCALWLFAPHFLQYNCSQLNIFVFFAVAAIVLAACIDYALSAYKTLTHTSY